MNGAQPRVSSPEPGSSILMTSAPMSPSSIVQNGPASTRVRSMTFSPSRGGMHVYQNPRSFHHAKATRQPDGEVRERDQQPDLPPVPQPDLALREHDGGVVLPVSLRPRPL